MSTPRRDSCTLDSVLTKVYQPTPDSIENVLEESVEWLVGFTCILHSSRVGIDG
jgi:hypothetical protein